MTEDNRNNERAEEEVNSDDATSREAAGQAEAQGDPDAGPQDAENTDPADAAEELTDPLSEAMNTISSLEDQLARSRADAYNLQQEYNGFVRRSKQEGKQRREDGVTSVIENLLPVLDDVELARQHGDLQGTTGQIAEKIEQILTTNFEVERFGAEGDEFDPTIHEALMHQTSPDATGETVGTLIQPGYRQGDKLLRPARVGVVSPE